MTRLGPLPCRALIELRSAVRVESGGTLPVGGGLDSRYDVKASSVGVDPPQGNEPVGLDPAEFSVEIDNVYWPMPPGARGFS
jgi:hypothetical protein